MTILLEKDDPILRTIAVEIPSSEFGSLELNQLAEDMIAIMKEKGAVGVAAPQIGVSKRMIVFGTSYTKSRNVDEPIPDTVILNPSIKVLSDEMQTGTEGCLNCGELRGDVPRAMYIEYRGYDVAGNEITKQASGLEARILQHEVDHLDGILFFDRVVDEI